MRINVWQLFLICAAICSIGSVQTLNVLGLFPLPAISHFNFFRPIMHALAAAGHNVTVLSFYPDKNPPVGYKDLPFTGLPTFNNYIDLEEYTNRAFYYPFLDFTLFDQFGRETCNNSLNSEALAVVLNSTTVYDIIIMEQLNTDCLLAVAHILKVPVVALSSCPLISWHYERIGMPLIPSYIPSVFVGSTDMMNFPERVWNYVITHGMKLLYDWICIPAGDEMVRARFGPGIPSVADLAKQTSLFFVNQHFSLGGAKPLPPSVIELGGIHIQEAKPLSTELQQYLDNAPNGVVLISWGSVVRANSLAPEKRDGLLRAIARLKQKVIWKWGNDTLPNKPDNLLMSEWLPQRDILCHPNVKVFMTHAGMGGTSEAAYCGVPVVATPVIADQFLNAAAMSHRGMGIVLSYKDLNEENVFNAVNKVLQPSFQKNAKLVSQSFRNRPQTAKETAIWWVEYVANTKGAPLLKSHSVFLSRFVYYSLDVYLFFAILLISLVVSGHWLLRKLFAQSTPKTKTKSA